MNSQFRLHSSRLWYLPYCYWLRSGHIEVQAWESQKRRFATIYYCVFTKLFCANIILFCENIILFGARNLYIWRAQFIYLVLRIIHILGVHLGTCWAALWVVPYETLPIIPGLIKHVGCWLFNDPCVQNPCTRPVVRQRPYTGQTQIIAKHFAFHTEKGDACIQICTWVMAF